MKTIGLIGGMSWESAVPCYRIINEEVKSRPPQLMAEIGGVRRFPRRSSILSFACVNPKAPADEPIYQFLDKFPRIYICPREGVSPCGWRPGIFRELTCAKVHSLPGL